MGLDLCIYSPAIIRISRRHCWLKNKADVEKALRIALSDIKLCERMELGCETNSRQHKYSYCSQDRRNTVVEIFPNSDK
jgi:hypothetical protein